MTLKSFILIKHRIFTLVLYRPIKNWYVLSAKLFRNYGHDETLDEEDAESSEDDEILKLTKLII